MRILIVDDSSTMRKIVLRSIRKSGVKVTEILEAQNGKEALDIICSSQVDLIFTDINMPEMNGLELIKELKSSPNTSSIPIIIISTEGTDDVISEAKQLGVDSFIRKPFTPETVKAEVEKITS